MATSAAVADCTVPLSFTKVKAVFPDESVILLLVPPPTTSNRSAEVPVIVLMRDKSTVRPGLSVPSNMTALACITPSVPAGCTISAEVAVVMRSPFAFKVES